MPILEFKVLSGITLVQVTLERNFHHLLVVFPTEKCPSLKIRKITYIKNQLKNNTYTIFSIPIIIPSSNIVFKPNKQLKTNIIV